MVPQADRDILGQLAARVAEIAHLPIQQERAELWRRHNGLDSPRPMVMASPEGSWDELIPPAALECEHKKARGFEYQLRQRIFRHEHIRDDVPVTNRLAIHGVYSDSGYGVKIPQQRTAAKGSAHWDPPIVSPEDVGKLRLPELSVDHDATAQRVAEVQELLGENIEVHAQIRRFWSLGLTQDLIYLRGLMQVMMDVYDSPELLHELMRFLRDAWMHRLDFWEAEGMLWENWHADSYVGSGGIGCTDELPANDYDGKVRCRDMWGLAESQEFSEIGPEQFAEFVLPYQKPLINRFGLACYGCCEAVHHKLDLLTEAIPRLRRVSVSPWCDRELTAAKLAGDYVYSWKPNPAEVCCEHVDWARVEDSIRTTVSIAGDHGCHLEMILKDTHTFQNDPARVGRWCDLARRIAEEAS